MDNNETTEDVVIEDTQPLDELESFLGGYKNISSQEQPIVNDNNAVNNIPIQQSQTTPNNTAINNPTVQYYRTGKKAGQVRPTKNTVNFNPANTNATLSGDILTGALFITLIDLVLPMLIAGLNNRFSKGKIKASDLGLTASQKKEIAPIADKVVKQFDFNGNPNLLFGFSLVSIYAANFALLKMSTKPNEKEHEKNS